MDVIPRSTSLLDNVTVNTNQSSEQSSVESGYTSNDFSKTYTVNGSNVLFSNGIFTGSFSGSFVGDGSQLSGVTSYTDSDNTDHLNTLGVISGSSQITDGSGILSSSNENFTTFSSSVDSRLDDIQTYTSSLKTAISVSGTNVTVLGNLDVQGTTTTVDSSTINISGSLLKLNYGGGAVDGGIEVTDATLSGLDTGSLIWDGTNNYWKGGVKGSEVKLLRAGGDGILSGSSQVAGSLPSGVISGSQQVIDSLSNQDVDFGTGDISASNLAVADKITHQDDPSTEISFTNDNIDFFTNGRQNIRLTPSETLVNFNNRSDMDFRVAGDTQTHTFFVDASSDNVGFGTNVPSESLHVAGTGRIGTLKVDDYIQHDGDTSTMLSFDTNQIDLFAGGRQNIRLTSTETLVNFNNRADMDFRVAGDTDANTFFVDSSTNRVGIGKNDPSTKLEVEGTVSASYFRGDGTYLTGITANAVSWDNITSKPSDIVSSSAQTITNLGGSGVISGSSQITDGSGLLSSSNENFTTFSSSVDSRLDSLETDTGSQDSRLDSLELYTQSLDITNAVITGSFTGSFIGDGSGLTGITATGTVSGSDQLTSSLDLLYESQGSGILSSSNETFVEFSSSVDSRLDSLETDTGSQDSRLDSLEAATSSYYNTTSDVVSALSNQTFDLGSADITANSFTGDGSNLTNITVAQAATVSETFTNSSSITVTHNFNTRNVIVVVYDSGNNQIIPSNVNTTNLDQAVITLSGAQSGTVVVAKGGHIISGNASSFGGNFSSNVSLNSYTLSGSGNIDFVGDLTVNGNTTITGTLTLSNADDIRIEDNILLLNWGKGTTDGGLQVSAQSGATGSIFWDESAGVWKGGTVGNELTFLRSGDVPSISALNTFTSSADNSITLLETISSSHESRLDTLEAATSSYQSLGAGVLSGSQQITNFGFISGSDLDSLNTYTQSNDTRIDGLDLFTSSFQTAITLDTTNVTILGNLTVQGTQTILDTTTLNIADKNLLIASGAANSAAADGAGITIDGAGATLLYKSLGDNFLFNKTVSGSFSGDFTGDGSSLTFNGTNIVSSSQQVIDFLPTGVVSGSDQTIANLPTGTVSGSTQITDGSGIVSSSQQVIDHLPTGTISGSQQVVDSLPTGTISGSGQLPSGIISGSTYTNFSSSIDARLDSVESYTGSLDITNAILTGSFTGSFVGDGSGLTGLTVDQVASITASFSNQSTINVAHNFNSYNVIASIYDSNYSQLIPQSVNLTDTNTLQVVLSGAHSGHVVVAKGGHVLSSQDTYTETVSGNSTYSITHNLDSEYPFVQAWNTSTKKIEQPQDIESNSANEITITFSGVFGGKVIVKK